MVLALGRRSRLPIIQLLSVIFIEFVRGVPLITVLFMANTMLPLFVPQEYSPDRLLRPLIGVALFGSALALGTIEGMRLAFLGSALAVALAAVCAVLFVRDVDRAGQ